MSPTPMMTLAQAHALLPGSTLVGNGRTGLARVHSDSRTLQPGDLFVALRGERFDAHDYLAQARRAGACAALAERGLADASLPGLQVLDSLVALQQLARAWRTQHPLPLVAVTGSNGKTTVTQMLASVLRAWQGEAALATAGNLNNHIGLPLSVLRLRPEHGVAVLELGMNHPGEIALLAQIAQPTVVLVNNAQREHQEFMASVEAVAWENGAAISALPADGVAVYPATDAHAAVWLGLAGGRRTLGFALLDGADAAAPAQAEVWGHGDWVDGAGQGGEPGGEQASHWSIQLHSPAGQVRLALYAPGRHNLHNALASAAAALALGAPLAAITAGLQTFRPVAGRSQLHMLRLAGRAITLVDDSYNANPDSVHAAIGLLAGLPGPHWLLLGDMGEVGDQGPTFHAEVGAQARQAGIQAFWTVGPLCAHAAAAFGGSARHFDNTAQLLEVLARPVAAGDQDLPEACASVLVKGSRFMRMEKIVGALLLRASSEASGADHAA